MKVTVKTIDAQSVQLDVEASLTVKELKTVILEKMNSVGKQIRLIWRGKVLNDEKKLSDYATDELMLHLVYRPPPREDDGPSNDSGAGSDQTTPSQPVSTNQPRVIDHTHEVVIVQGGTADIPASITQITQGLVDRVLGSLNAQGAMGTVTATASLHDSTGRRETAQVSASTSDQTPKIEPSVPPPSDEPPPPTTQPAHSQPPPSQPQPPAATPVVDPPPTTRENPPTQKEEEEEEDEEQESREEQRERMQEYRNQKSIRGHVKNAYNCLQYADKVLLRYKKASDRAAGLTVDPNEEVEPIEEVSQVLANNAGPTSASIYVALLRYQEELLARIRPLTQRMISTVQRSQPHEELEAWKEAQIAQTVREFNYYMGHASVSLSRLHVNMFAPPPRDLVVTAPKTTEMRGIMSHMRSVHTAPRPPSGYVIEITHRDESGRERTTRAQLDTGGRPGGLLGGLGRGGGGGGGMGLGGGMGMGMGLGGGMGGFAEFLRQRREQRERDEEERNKAEEGSDEKEAVPTEMETEPGNSAPQEEGMDTSTPPPAKKPSLDPAAEHPADSDQPTASASVEAGSGGVTEGGATKKEEPMEQGATGRGLTDMEKEVTEYLARLVAHIMTGTPMIPPSHRRGEASGGSNEGQSNESGGDLTFAQRFAGPPGTKVTIKQPPQPAMFPGMPPMDGPSITINNPGDGAEPEMNVNFPMPPALQLLRSLLAGDSDSDSDGDDEEGKKEGEEDDEGKKEGENDDESKKAESGASNAESSKSTDKSSKSSPEDSASAGEGSKSTEKKESEAQHPLFGRRKKPQRKPEEEPSRSELWGDDKSEVDSISNAGSLDSFDSDHEVPPIDPPVITPAVTGEQAEAGAAARESMLNMFTQLRHRYTGDVVPQDTEDDMGMVERLLQDISKRLSVLEVMSVFNGATAPLEQLQPVLKEFVRERLLFGDIPDPGRESEAVRNFLQGCLPSLRAIEDQLPLRDAGIDFPMTIYRFFSGQFRALYQLIVKDFPGEGQVFGSLLSHWGRTTSAVFGLVLRHCIDGDQYFEDLVKMLVNTLFPPTTPPLILNMCNSTIHRQLARVKSRPTKSPPELDKYVVWKEGATPKPNTSYNTHQFLVGHPEYRNDMPTVFLHNIAPEGVEVIPPTEEPPPTEETVPPPALLPQRWVETAQQDQREMESKRPMPFSDAYLAGMPSKKRKQLDMSGLQMVTADSLVRSLVTNTTSELTPCGARSSQEVRETLLADTERLSGALRQDIQRGIAKRLMEDPNFNRDKYSNVCDYFQVPPSPPPPNGGSN